MFKKILKWLDNDWYHYKWLTLAILFFAFCGTVIIVQTVTKTTPDCPILYGGPCSLTPNQTKELENAFTYIVPSDFNGDGEKTVELRPIVLMTKEQLAAAESEAAANSSVLIYSTKALADNKTGFTTQLFSGENIICLLDPEQYKDAHESGGFAKLSDLFGENNIPDCAYDDCALKFSETGFAKFFTASEFLPEDTLLCVRNMSINSVFKGKEKAEKDYNNQLEFYYAIVNFGGEQTNEH